MTAVDSELAPTTNAQISIGNLPTSNSLPPPSSFALLLCLAGANFFRIGCQLVTTAWSAVQITGRPESVGHVLLVSSAASLVLSPFIGAFIDRCSRKKPFVLAGHFGVAICGASPVALDFAVPHVAPFFSLIVATLLSSVSGMVLVCSMDYFTKLAIPSNERTKKLATINSVSQLTLIAGTAFGGYLVSCTAWRDAFLLIGGCGLLLTVLSACLLPSLTYTPGIRRERHRFGPSLYMRHRHLFSIAACSALAYAVGQVTNTLLPAFINLDLKLSGASYSLVKAAWSIGALGASAALARVARGQPCPLHHDLCTVLLIAGLLAVVPFLSALKSLVAVHLALGVGFAIVRVRSEARFLTECPTHLLARFRANSLFLTSSISAIVFVTPTVCSNFATPALYELLSAVIAVSAVALMACSKVRREARSTHVGR
ncbi:MFS transporter [Trinickia dinghuensis]|uniref:MFS transporter n=1 Tax=Trinickia dinghuensis TaxID=2291023 RepID=A0A3D8JW30_9BURK|nr:MFS transporter [Trinickia dinghuensis]RDU97002.1 MFS transporter [Trinickia dinghuensis]